MNKILHNLYIAIFFLEGRNYILLIWIITVPEVLVKYTWTNLYITIISLSGLKILYYCNKNIKLQNTGLLPPTVTMLVLFSYITTVTMLVLFSLILKLHISLKSHTQQKVMQPAYQSRVKESARLLIWGTKLHLIVQHPLIGCSVLTTWRWLMALLVAGNFIQILIMSPWRMVQVSNCDHLSLFSMNSELGLQTANSREYVPQKAFQLGHQRDTLHISPSWSLRICLTNVTSIRRVTKTCPCRLVNK